MAQDILKSISESSEKISKLKNEYPQEYEAATKIFEAVLVKVRQDRIDEIDIANLGRVEQMRLANALVRKSIEDREVISSGIEAFGDVVGKIMRAVLMGMI